jgi:hypothetical protein
MGAGGVRRIADRGEVDRPVPSQQQAHVPVDRRPLRRRELDAQLGEALIEGVPVGGGQWWSCVDARRERLALTIQCTPPVSRAARTCAAPLPAATRIAGWPVGLPRSVRFPARVSPIASRTALPFRHGADAGRYGRRPVAVNGVIHQPAGGRWIRG